MAGYFSRMFDPPSRPSYFGPQADPEDATSDDAPDQPRPRGAFFSPDLALFLQTANSPQQYFGSLAPPVMGGMSAGRSGSWVVPAVANFGVQGHSLSEYTDPNDYPWRGYPDVDPRMPFFVLPPNAVFNMPVYKWKQVPSGVPPWVGKEGRPHLDGINPDDGRLVTPGKEI